VTGETIAPQPALIVERYSPQAVNDPAMVLDGEVPSLEAKAAKHIRQSSVPEAQGFRHRQSPIASLADVENYPAHGESLAARRLSPSSLQERKSFWSRRLSFGYRIGPWIKNKVEYGYLFLLLLAVLAQTCFMVIRSFYRRVQENLQERSDSDSSSDSSDTDDSDHGPIRERSRLRSVSPPYQPSDKPPIGPPSPPPMTFYGSPPSGFPPPPPAPFFGPSPIGLPPSPPMPFAGPAPIDIRPPSPMPSSGPPPILVAHSPPRRWIRRADMPSPPSRPTPRSPSPRSSTRPAMAPFQSSDFLQHPPGRRRRALVPKYPIFDGMKSKRPRYSPLNLRLTRWLWERPNSINEAFHTFRYTYRWDVLDKGSAYGSSTVRPELDPCLSSILAATDKDHSMISTPTTSSDSRLP
jgi:hypothetical protein